MKNLNSKTTIIIHSYDLVHFSCCVCCNGGKPVHHKSSFRKKVERVERMKAVSPHNLNIDCMYYTDGTVKYFPVILSLIATIH